MSEDGSKLQVFGKGLDEIEDQINKYIRQDVIEICNRESAEAVDGFNKWVRATQAGLDKKREAIILEREQLDEEKKHLDRIGLEDHDRVDQYNIKVRDHNGRARELENDRAQFRREAKQKSADVDELQTTNRKRAGEFIAWSGNRGHEEVSRSLNLLYARIRLAARSSHLLGFELDETTVRSQELRRELAEHAREHERKADNGVLLEPTTAYGAAQAKEQCLMLVDAGTTLTSITPELVDILGLRHTLGDEIELSLPFGIRKKARTLTLPQLSVQGMVARDVEAVVVEVARMGVDGCLGLSFLNNFSYRIERGHPQILHLSSREPFKTYDVFISYGPDDLTRAREVYDAVAKAGLRPCPLGTRETLPEGARNSIIAESRRFIVVTSSANTVSSGMVASEWRSFLDSKSHEGASPLVSVLYDGITVPELPPPLRDRHAVSASTRDWRATLLHYLGHGH